LLKCGWSQLAARADFDQLLRNLIVLAHDAAACDLADKLATAPRDFEPARQMSGWLRRLAARFVA
jgi:hypothetical protein